MTSSLDRAIFSGGSTLGIGFFDFLSSSNNTSNFTSCPAGFTYNYNPSTNSGTCVPEAGGVTVKIDGKEVNPYQSTGTDCPVGFDYVKRADGTGTCVAKANVTTSNQTWGTTTYNPGADSYKPTSNVPFCPSGYTFDTKAGKCVKVQSGGGSSVPTTPTTPVSPTPPPSLTAGINPLHVAAVVLGLAAVGAVAWKIKKKRDEEYAPNWDDFAEEG